MRLLFAFVQYPGCIDARDGHDRPEQGTKENPKNAIS